jgi:ribosomal protein L19E
MPATSDNAGAASGFPHCGIGTGAICGRFRQNSKELAMAARHKTTRKTARKAATRKAGTARRKTGARKPSPKRWSQRVTQESDALDLKRGVFKLTSAKKIAASLKRSAEHSSRRKSGAYRSALSMLTFYINRAGKTLPKTQRERLERAKVELKHQFGRE